MALVRSQSGLPALGEVLEPLALGHLVSGWMRGSHNGPIMPCSFDTAHPTRLDGPPRAGHPARRITPQEQPMRTLAAVAQAIAAEIHNLLVWLMPPDQE